MKDTHHLSLNEIFAPVHNIVDAQFTSDDGHKAGYQKLSQGERIDCSMPHPGIRGYLTAIFTITHITEMSMAEMRKFDMRASAVSAAAHIAMRTGRDDAVFRVIEVDKGSIQAAYHIPMKEEQVQVKGHDGKLHTATKRSPIMM